MLATMAARRQLFAYVGGFLTAALLATVLSLSGALPHGASPRVGAAGGPTSYISNNPNVRSSSALYLAQYFRDHMAQMQQAAKHAPATAGAPARAPLFTAPGGALSFNSDTGAYTQNSESYAIDPTTTGSQAGMIGVGGFTDFRGFFFNNSANTEAGYAVSKNVACLAGTCSQLLKDGWIPGVTDPLCTDGTDLTPGGEPALAVSASGTFYYATLAFQDFRTGSGCGGHFSADTGIIIAKSNGNLENPAVPCNDNLTANACWSSTLIHETAQSGCQTSTTPCSSDDKEWIAVDPVSGNVTAAWDFIDDLNGGSFVDATTCNSSVASCSAVTKVSVPISGCTPMPNQPPCDNTFAPYLAIWHNPVSNVNNVVMTYVQNTVCNPNCDTELHLADLTTHTDQTFLTLQPYQDITGLSNTQFSFNAQVKVAADFRSVASPHIYVTWEQCKSAGTDGAGADYYFDAGFFEGACAQSTVHVFDFTSATGAGTGIPVLGGFNQFYPSVAVDEVGATAGQVALGYYSTQGDGAASALIRPYAATSSGGATPTAFSANTYQAVLTANFRYTADPFFTTQRFGASPMGDYMQVATANGAVFLHFNGTYEKKTGPQPLGTVAVNQSDNYLCYIQPGTAIATSGACTSA